MGGAVMIVKIQKPLGGGEGDAFIYDEDRSVMYLTPIKNVISLFGKNELKIFRYAELIDTKLHIGKIAPWQDW
jgi:hypothetical protein